MSATNTSLANSYLDESIYDFSEQQRSTISEAIGFLETQLKAKDAFTNPLRVKQYCQLHIGTHRDEFFGCLFLDAQHCLIAFEGLFRGTIDGATIHPRVVVRRALALNAAAVIFTHNHPSGVTTPSTADVAITKKLVEALKLIDIRVLDHIVTGTFGCSSMAEQGLL